MWRLSKGYYAAEGLGSRFSYGGNINDLLLQTATGQLPFVMAAGDEVLLARSQGIPIKIDEPGVPASSGRRVQQSVGGHR